MLLQSNAAVGLLSLLAINGVRGQESPAVNTTRPLRGFKPCDALIAADLEHAVHPSGSSLYPNLVKGSWTKATQRTPYCFVVPSTTDEVSRTLAALGSAGNGAGDWHVAIRSGGHGSDRQNSVTDGVIIDLSYLNAITYNPETKVASIVGVGRLTLGGGVGWTTPRTGFACDNVINYEVVLANGEIINANASDHPDLWRALKGGSSNFGIVTKFDIDTFPASNITLERRTIGPDHTDEFRDAIVDYADLDQSYAENAMVSVISYMPGAGITMTITEVNTVNDVNTTAFDKFDRIPALATTGKKSYTLPDAAAVDAPELDKSQESLNVGAGAVTIANDRRVVRYLFDQHVELIASLNATIGGNFTTMIEMQPLPTYFADIGVQKGGNMLGLDKDPRNKLYFALAATLTSPECFDQQPQVLLQVLGAVEKVKAYAKLIGADEDFVYLPYAKALQDPLGGYGADNVRHIKEVAARYDPTRFFQRMVPGGFKIDRVG
ncbi:hypothetical protein Q7P37_009461 [Cladosporium fusiforme]